MAIIVFILSRIYISYFCCCVFCDLMWDLVIAVSSLTYESRLTSWHLPLPRVGWDSEVRGETTITSILISIPTTDYVFYMSLLNHCEKGFICRNDEAHHSNIALNTLRLRQNGRHLPDDIFKCILLNEDVVISIKILLKFVWRGPINNIPVLVQIMTWHRPGENPSSEPMMVILPTHICVTRLQWVKIYILINLGF